LVPPGQRRHVDGTLDREAYSSNIVRQGAEAPNRSMQDARETVSAPHEWRLPLYASRAVTDAGGRSRIRRRLLFEERQDGIDTRRAFTSLAASGWAPR